MRLAGVLTAVAAGLLIAGIVVGAFGGYVTKPVQTTTVTQTETTTATTMEPTTITQTTTQTQTSPTTVTRTVTKTTTTGPFEVPFSFNESIAVGFYGSLMSPLGLFTDYPGSHTVWLADDQALDYFALLGLYYTTESSTALSLAQQVNSSIAGWGGFYKYWNPVFEVFGGYNTTMDVCGTNQGISVAQGYTIDATVFKPCPGFQYSLFADLLAYHVLLDIHEGNYTAAESEFSQLSGMWDGHGFSDQPFQQDPTQTYQSYKLADYVIAWKALADDSFTRQFALGYDSTVHGVAAVMSKLQSSAGGVWTGYRVSNGQISYVDGSPSATNGETTSLFILASARAIYSIPLPVFSDSSTPPSVVTPNLILRGATACVYKGTDWVFWKSLSFRYFYNFSTDGVHWTKTGLMTQMPGSYFSSVYCKGDQVFSTTFDISGDFLNYSLGTLNPGNGTISWSVFDGDAELRDRLVPLNVACGEAAFQSAIIDSEGNQWLAFANSSGSCDVNGSYATNYMEVIERVGGSWVARLGPIEVIPRDRGDLNGVNLLPLTGGKVALLRVDPSNYSNLLIGYWNGSGWTSNRVLALGTVGNGISPSVTSMGDSVLLAFGDRLSSPPSVRFASIEYGHDLSNIITVVTMDAHALPEVGISSDNAANVLLVYDSAEAGAPIRYCKSIDRGVTWDACDGTLVTGEWADYSPFVNPRIVSNIVGVAWLDGLNPYSALHYARLSLNWSGQARA